MKEQWNEAWASFWDARDAREKILLTWGGTFLLLVLIYLTLWAPAQDGRARLNRTLQAMQQQLAQMTAQAVEARALAASGQGAIPTGGALQEALTASLSEHGFGATQVQRVGDGVQIQLKNASFPAWTQWLNNARQQFKVQVREAHVTALKTDGQVDLTAVMQAAAAP